MKYLFKLTINEIILLSKRGQGLETRSKLYTFGF